MPDLPTQIRLLDTIVDAGSKGTAKTHGKEKLLVLFLKQLTGNAEKMVSLRMLRIDIF